MYRMFRILLALAISLAATSALAVESAEDSALLKKDPLGELAGLMPAPDAGFEWALFRNCVFLQPAGWNAKTLPGAPDIKSSGLYLQTPEELSENRVFEHLFTVMVLPGFKAARGVSPTQGAQAMIRNLARVLPANEVPLLEEKPSPLGKSYVFRFSQTRVGKTPMIIHNYYMPDDGQDLLYIFTYESPAETWEENWKYFGTRLVQKVSVIPFLSPLPEGG